MKFGILILCLFHLGQVLAERKALDLGNEDSVDGGFYSFPRPNFDHFGEDWFRDDDPFKQMQNMRKRMSDMFKQSESQFDWSGNASSVNGDISLREDENYYYFDVDTNNIQKDALDISVDNGYIKIKGKRTERKETQSEGQSSSYSMSSTFSRMIGLPRDAAASRAEIITKDDKVVIKIPRDKTMKFNRSKKHPPKGLI